MRHGPALHRRRHISDHPGLPVVRLVGDLAGGPEPGGLMTGRTSRAERLTMPLARDAIRVLADARGGCIRPVQLRRTNLDTGQADQQIIPCGSTLEADRKSTRLNSSYLGI